MRQGRDGYGHGDAERGSALPMSMPMAIEMHFFAGDSLYCDPG